PPGPDVRQTPLEDLDGTRHLVVRRRDRLVAHACTSAGPEMRVPTASPAATLAMLSAPLRSNTTIGRSFSMHSETAAPSMTLSWSRSRSVYSSRSYLRAPGTVIGSAS